MSVRALIRSLPLLVSVFFLQAFEAHARLLQIIHTNDLHSHLEHAENPGFGSYAAVKAIIDQLKADASQQGIPALTVDAGDFTEGSQFFLADSGRESWRVMDAMGYDAVTLGNHDWLMGTKALDRIVGDVQPRFELLGANFLFDPGHTNLARFMKATAHFVRDGIRIGLLGLVTQEMVYKWRVDEGTISSPVGEANLQLPELKKQSDVVIALTHLGISYDSHLVSATRGIDLVIGGHSHTVLDEPVVVRDRSGQAVPIVQAGKHGEFVGDLLVDVEPGKPLQVLRYKLIPVSADGPKDPAIDRIVKSVRQRLEQDYGSDWLSAPIAESEVPLERPQGHDTVWGKIVDDAMWESARTELSLNIPEFFGNGSPAGPVTREKLFQFYPRVFGLDERHGWTIWTGKIQGWALATAISQAEEHDARITFGGLTYDVITDSKGNKIVKHIRVRGRPLHRFKSYRVALPEGIGRGARDITSFSKLLIFSLHDTHVPIWEAVERKLHSLGGRVPASLPSK